jgi:mevalonate kinase
MSQKFRSNGKLMITGEYLALQGATTLAVPLIFGQELQIEEVSHSLVYWRTLFKEKLYFTPYLKRTNLVCWKQVTLKSLIG